jgi:hypothetical protein
VFDLGQIVFLLDKDLEFQALFSRLRNMLECSFEALRN